MTPNRKRRRLTAILLAVIMIISCLPASLTAEEGNVSVTPWTPPKGILTDYTIVAEDNAQISFDVESGAASVIYISSGVVTLSTQKKTNERIVINGNASVILDGVTIEAEGGPAIEIEPGCSATLVLEGTNNVSVTSGQFAAVEPIWNEAKKTGATLTITGSGSLTANGGSNSAAIGGSYSRNVHGNIIIALDNGTITANGGSDSAGIGTSATPGGS